MHTSETNFSIFVIEYLGEIETEFENTIACLSGAQMGSNHEKRDFRTSERVIYRTVILHFKGILDPSYTEHSFLAPTFLPWAWIKDKAEKIIKQFVTIGRTEYIFSKKFDE